MLNIYLCQRTLFFVGKLFENTMGRISDTADKASNFQDSSLNETLSAKKLFRCNFFLFLFLVSFCVEKSSFYVSANLKGFGGWVTAYHILSGITRQQRASCGVKLFFIPLSTHHPPNDTTLSHQRGKSKFTALKKILYVI